MAIKYIRADLAYAERMNAVGMRAFRNGGLQRAIFPERLRDPEDPGAQDRDSLERIQKRLRNPGIVSFVAVDEDIRDEDGQVRVLGYSAWHAPGQGDNAEDEDGADETRDGWVDDGQGGKRGDGKKHPKCMDVEAMWDVVEVLKATRREVLGVHGGNVWYLGSLAVDPEFSGRGIASELARWGIAKADEDGVLAYLEATAAAKGVYTRAGFESIKVVRLRGDGDEPHTAMLTRPGRAVEKRGDLP